MGEHDDEVNRELLDFGREFDIDLGSICADGVSEAFSEAIAVELDTTAFALWFSRSSRSTPGTTE